MTALDLRHRHLVNEGPRNVLERLLLALLRPLGLLYGVLGAVRVQAYRWGIFPVHRAGIPVVSVGNLSVGGTGKTPVVDHIVKFYLARGKKVAVVSRGYGGRIRKGVGVVSRGSGPLLTPAECGDEPFLLARRNPAAFVLVARRRAEGVRMAEHELGAEVIVLDDGFQHLAVARDLDIVLLDSRRPLGNGRVLPAGLLREFPAALERADLFLLTRCEADLVWEPPVPRPVVACRHVLASEVQALSGAVVPLAELAGKSGVAFAGVANPQDFFAALTSHGLVLTGTFPFPDHVDYNPEMLVELLATYPQTDYLITTEKDAVKLPADSFSIPCYQAPMSVHFLAPEGLETALERLGRSG